MKVTGFRDPTPFTHAGTQYLLVGSGIAGKGGMVLLYRAAKLPNGSPDLTQWEYLHPLAEGNLATTRTSATDPVDTGEMWECPDFFSLANRHVLIYSTERKTFWQVGDLDPKTLTFHATATGQLDLGRSFYAPKTQLDAHGNRILWGWLAETRPEAEYDVSGWSGMLSLPRVLTVEDGQLRQHPLPALRSLREPVAHNIVNAEFGPHMLLSSSRRINEFTATLQQNARPDIASTCILADPAGPLVTIRSHAGQEASPADITLPANTPLSKNPTLHIFFDNSVLELFLDNSLCFTKRFYTRDPKQPVATLILPGSYTTIEPTAYTLKPIWPA